MLKLSEYSHNHYPSGVKMLGNFYSTWNLGSKIFNSQKWWVHPPPEGGQANPPYELAFGVAVALVVILVWVDLVSLILLFEAEFIRVYSRRFGLHTQPKAYAEVLTVETRAVQGIPLKEPEQPLEKIQAFEPETDGAYSPNTDSRSICWHTNNYGRILIARDALR